MTSPVGIDHADYSAHWLDLDGRQVSAPVRRMREHAVALECTESSVELKTSQALSDFRVLSPQRELYRGRAVISNLIQTATGLIVQASLDDPWHRLPDASPSVLCAELKDWIARWQTQIHLCPKFKEAVVDLQAFLGDLRLWCEQIELESSQTGEFSPSHSGRELSSWIAPSIDLHLRELFDRFEQAVRPMDSAQREIHCALARQLLHPILLCSPFVNRTYRKPLGHAGDYEVVNMMFRDPHEGSSLVARVINYYALQLPPIQAHRNRIKRLLQLLTTETLRVNATGRSLRYLSIGCGPAIEVQQFAQQSPLATKAAFRLIDFDTQAISHLNTTLPNLPTCTGRPIGFQTERRSLASFLRDLQRTLATTDAPTGYDLISCAGLFDYLPSRVCRQAVAGLERSLFPGGRLIVTNVDANPSRFQMEFFLDWHVIARNRKEMEEMVPPSLAPEDVTIKSDLTGVNLFLEITKPKPSLA